MPGQDSQLKQAAEALSRENERIEAANRRKDKEIADLLKKIQYAKKMILYNIIYFYIVHV